MFTHCHLSAGWDPMPQRGICASVTMLTHQGLRPSWIPACAGMTPSSTQKGFTLIELLVVLVLIGLLMAIAVPNIRNVYNNFQNDLIIDEIRQELTGLSFKAYLSRKTVTLEDINLPEGMSFSEESKIEVRPDGYCAGGNVVVNSGDEKFMFHLAPPLCKPELLESENEN